MLTSTPNMASQGLSNAFAGQTLIPSASLSPIAPRAVLGLTQVEGWEPVQSFADSSGLQWVLSKASSDSTRDVPDPKSIQLLHCWNHEFRINTPDEGTIVGKIDRISSEPATII